MPYAPPLSYTSSPGHPSRPGLTSVPGLSIGSTNNIIQHSITQYSIAPQVYSGHSHISHMLLEFNRPRLLKLNSIKTNTQSIQNRILLVEIFSHTARKYMAHHGFCTVPQRIFQSVPPLELFRRVLLSLSCSCVLFISAY